MHSTRWSRWRRRGGVLVVLYNGGGRLSLYSRRRPHRPPPQNTTTKTTVCRRRHRLHFTVTTTTTTTTVATVESVDGTAHHVQAAPRRRSPVVWLVTVNNRSAVGGRGKKPTWTCRRKCVSRRLRVNSAPAVREGAHHRVQCRSHIIYWPSIPRSARVLQRPAPGTRVVSCRYRRPKRKRETPRRQVVPSYR